MVQGRRRKRDGKARAEYAMDCVQRGFDAPLVHDRSHLL